VQRFDGGVVSADHGAAPASFDEKHEVLDAHNHHPVVWRICYARQCDAITEAMAPGKVVVDLGCGPAAPYRRPAGSVVVGVDPSLPSLAANDDLDLALHTSATQVPLHDDSADVVIAVYSLHHMIGDSVAASWRNVESAFAEISRLAKPGAEVLVLEICPWAPVWAAEVAGWSAARRALGSVVDFVFWPAKRLQRLGERSFPGARFELRRFGTQLFDLFPPLIGKPGLQIPWLLYPFDVCLLRWQLPEAT
jgi:SAM-dependent methyltransferase